MARAKKAADPLATYNAKRDFGKTPEPSGKAESSAGGNVVDLMAALKKSVGEKTPAKSRAKTKKSA